MLVIFLIKAENVTECESFGIFFKKWMWKSKPNVKASYNSALLYNDGLFEIEPTEQEAFQIYRTNRNKEKKTYQVSFKQIIIQGA